MSPQPVIFLSAVSSELKSARQLVANTLTFLGYAPDWQDIFGAEQGDLRAMLRRRIDASAGVVQIVGKSYGAEPPTPDPQFGRCSYTQYEALYARSRGKKVWYLFLDDDFPADPHQPEPEELRALQQAYIRTIHQSGQLYQPLKNREGLEASVLKLRDDLTHLRRGVKQWAFAVAAMLLLLLGIGFWQMKSGGETKSELAAMKAEMAKLREGVNALPAIQAQTVREQPGLRLDQVDDRAYAELARQLGIDEKKLRAELPAFANKLLAAADTPLLERANAAYVAKDYPEAERLALAAAEEARKASPTRTSDAIKAYELAGQAAEQRIHYKDAVRHLRSAENFTVRERDPAEWARVQFALARVLYADGDYRGAGAILLEVVKEQTATLGPNDPATLLSRLWFGIALSGQGKSREAEQELGTVVTLETRTQGSEHADTLKARNNLANTLYFQGKYAEAEREHRVVLTIRERVLGAEHPDTLMSRNNLASALNAQGKSAEAEREHRAVLALRERVLGTEHPDTLKSRMNLANALQFQGKHTEAEQEYRAVLALQERVLGAEHPSVFLSCYNLTFPLVAQSKYVEALTLAQRAEAGWHKVLGAEHPDSKRATEQRKWIEAKIQEVNGK